ncbi:MAG: methyl-accepting chemotaxis protein, partial [Psychrosphaera sp.]|nr:methyl-accepting chemotaxis protein [Psychrosphaera sp.]
MLSQLSFSQKIIFAASVLLVIVQISTTAANYYSLHNSTRESLDRSIAQVGRSVSANIANWLNGKLGIVVSVADSSSKVTSNEAILAVVQQGRDAGNFKNVFVGVEASGDFILDDLAVLATLPA